MTILNMSLHGAVLIAVILLLRRALLYRVPKWTFLLLWAVALGRLLIPFTLPSQFSEYTGAAKAAQYFEEEAPAAPSEIFPTVTEPKPVPGSGSAAPAPEPEQKPIFPAAAIYLTGVGLCALFFAAAYLWELRRFRKAVPVKSSFLSKWQTEHPTFLPVEIKCCTAVNAPLLYGLLRPVILLPGHTDWADTDQLTCVLTHEYVHIRRGDLYWKLLLTAALCVHCFNPLVWAMFLYANRDLELACDETVIRILGLDSRKRYARSLLSAAESRFSPFYTTFTAQNHLVERIRAIMKMKRTSVAAILTATLLVASVTCVFATSKMPALKNINTLPQAVSAQALEPAAESSIAYHDVNRAETYEEYASIIEARSKIIYGEQSWTVDGAVKVFNADGSVEELPDFYDLFPSDWEPVRLPEKPWEQRYSGSMNMPDREMSGLYSGNVYFAEASRDDEIYPFAYKNLMRAGDIGIYPESLPENAETFTAGFYNEDTMKGIGWAASLSAGQGIFLSDAENWTRYGFIMSIPGSLTPGYGYVIVDYLDSGSFPVNMRLG